MDVILNTNRTPEEIENTFNTMARIFKREEYKRKHARFWFETTKNGIKLIRPNGTFVEDNEKSYGINKYWEYGYKRSCLYMREMAIWDATGFGATIDTITGFMIKPDIEISSSLPRCFFLTSPELAEKWLFTAKFKSERLIISREVKNFSRQCTEAFYNNKKAQLAWFKYILFGVCFIVDDHGMLHPYNLADINDTDFIKDNYFVDENCEIDDFVEMYLEQIQHVIPHNFSSTEPLDESYSNDDRKHHAQTLNLKALKKAALKRSQKVNEKKSANASSYVRDPYIAEYTKIRANGKCQLCELPAPFLDIDGRPYLECHHVAWLSMGGADSINNTVALCPNCHTRVHRLKSQADEVKLQKICSKYKI